MSYGFEIRNGNNQIVVDDSFPCCYLGPSSTVSGFKPYYSNVWFYEFSQVGRMPFFDLPVGHWVAYASEGTVVRFVSSLSSAVVRQSIPLPQLSYTQDPYGLEVYNAAGDPMFSSSENLIPVKGFTNDLFNNPSQGVFSSPTRWVCPIDTRQGLIPSPFINTAYLRCFAIKRQTSTTFTTQQENFAEIQAIANGQAWGKTAAIFA